MIILVEKEAVVGSFLGNESLILRQVAEQKLRMHICYSFPPESDEFQLAHKNILV
jgi:hypothetical protein